MGSCLSLGGFTYPRMAARGAGAFEHAVVERTCVSGDYRGEPVERKEKDSFRLVDSSLPDPSSSSLQATNLGVCMGLPIDNPTDSHFNVSGDIKATSKNSNNLCLDSDSGYGFTALRCKYAVRPPSSGGYGRNSRFYPASFHSDSFGISLVFRDARLDIESGGFP